MPKADKKSLHDSLVKNLHGMHRITEALYALDALEYVNPELRTKLMDSVDVYNLENQISKATENDLRTWKDFAKLDPTIFDALLSISHKLHVGIGDVARQQIELVKSLMEKIKEEEMSEEDIEEIIEMIKELKDLQNPESESDQEYAEYVEEIKKKIGSKSGGWQGSGGGASLFGTLFLITLVSSAIPR